MTVAKAIIPDNPVRPPVVRTDAELREEARDLGITVAQLRAIYEARQKYYAEWIKKHPEDAAAIAKSKWI